MPRSLHAAAVLLLLCLNEQPAGPAPLHGKAPASSFLPVQELSYTWTEGFPAGLSLSLSHAKAKSFRGAGKVVHTFQRVFF